MSLRTIFLAVRWLGDFWRIFGSDCDFFLALPSALGMSNMYWSKLNLNTK